MTLHLLLEITFMTNQKAVAEKLLQVGAVKLSPEHENFVWANIREAHRYPICDFTKRDIYHLQKHWIDFKGKNKSVSNEEFVDIPT